MADKVYAVHASRSGDVGAIEVVFATLGEARAHAVIRSCDHKVLAASVTEFRVGELGTRTPVTWYVAGREQDARSARPGGRYYPTVPGEQ